MTQTRRMFVTMMLSALALTRGALAEPATQPSAPLAVGEKARAFSLNDLEGKTVTLADTATRGPFALVVLRGWPGYQCPICTKQFADLRAKADEFRKRGTPVLLVYPGPIDRLDEHAREFLRNEKLPEGFTFVTDPGYAFVNAYGLRWNAQGETAYPSTFVIDKEQTVRFAKVSKGHGDRASAKEILDAIDAAK